MATATPSIHQVTKKNQIQKQIYFSDLHKHVKQKTITKITKTNRTQCAIIISKCQHNKKYTDHTHILYKTRSE